MKQYIVPQLEINWLSAFSDLITASGLSVLNEGYGDEEDIRRYYS